MTTLSLSQEYKILKDISTPEVMKFVFGNLAGYKVERAKNSYKEFLDAVTNMMTKK